jgi:hypothetical protein
MPVAIVTGSGGLVGSQAVSQLVEVGFDASGLVNDSRARFFGPGASTAPVTNAFKAYRCEVLADVEPLASAGFELTVELPLRAVVRDHRFVSVPVKWRDRAGGRAKFRLRAGWRYAVVVARLLRERSRRGTPPLPA